MNFLIAPDSFKDSLSALEVCNCIEKGILQIFPDASIKKVPVADGGEGTVEALVHATGGEKIKVNVHDPLYRKTQAFYGMLGDGETAVIEMAAASGIELLKEKERNPWITTTLGTGELIKDALDKGCHKIIIGIGGSATTDAGLGMATALGAKFFDEDGQELNGEGGLMGKVKEIDLSGFDDRIKSCEILVACDVNNPLFGKEGAAHVYGPQKGADEQMVKKLDNNLQHIGNLLENQLKEKVNNMPGAGAAGGLGAGLHAFLDAELKPGFQIIRETLKLDEVISWADIVITGEGKIDAQTRFGKTPHGVAQTARSVNKPVIAIAGTLGDGYRELYNHHFYAIFSVLDKPMDLQEALNNAPSMIEKCTENVMRLFKLGMTIN